MEKEENLTKPSQSQNEDNTSEQEIKNSDNETESKVDEKSEITPEQKKIEIERERLANDASTAKPWRKNSLIPFCGLRRTVRPSGERDPSSHYPPSFSNAWDSKTICQLFQTRFQIF